MSLLKESFYFILADFIPRIIGFLLLPIYTNYLTTTDYGIINYTNSFIMFLFVLCTFSLNTYLLKNYFDTPCEEKRKKMIGNIFLLIITINIFFSIVAYICTPYFIDKYDIKIPWNPYFQLAILNNFLEVFSIIPLVIYRVTQKAYLFLLLNLSRSLLQIIITYLFIVKLDFGLLGHYYGRLFSLLPFIYIYIKVIMANSIFDIKSLKIKKILYFSLPLLPGSFSYIILNFSDKLIMERFLSMSSIGVYSLAFTLTSILSMFIQAIYKTLEPEIFKQYQTKNFSEFIKKTQNNFFFIIFSIAMIITIFSQEIIKIMILNKEYHDAHFLIPILMIGVIMTSVNAIYSTILIVEKQNKIIGFATFWGALINLFFNIIFIEYGGIYVTAFSYSLSLFIMSTIIYEKVFFLEKEIKKVFWALILFIATNIFIFCIFLQFSFMEMIIIKIILFTLYVVILLSVFEIRLFFYREKS